MTFCRLENGRIVNAPDPLMTGSAVVYCPTEGQYLENGWKRYHESYPAQPAGEKKHWEPDGYDETETDVTKKWKSVDDPVIYRAWTPLTIMRGAKAQGFWTSMKAVLEANDAYDEFMACQYVTECDPGFLSIRAIIVAQIGEAETTAFLNGLKVEKTGTSGELLEAF